MIIEIKEKLNANDLFVDFANEARQWGRHEHGREEDVEDGAGDESFIGSEGQIFRNRLMGQLLRRSQQ
jgi:hypothetical protein